MLTLAAPYAKETTVAVQVDGVKVADSKDAFGLYAGTVTISDKVNAQISDVEGLTNGDVLKAVTISYSEPVKAGAAIKINGVKVGVTSNGTSQDISGLSLDSSKSHTVEIVNLTDGADNVNALATFSFNATKDTTAPAVNSVTALNDNQFVVEFSEKVNSASVGTGDFAVVKSATLASVNVTDVKPLTGDTTGTKYVVSTNLGSGDYATVSAISLNVAFAAKAFTDVAGNESAATTASVTLSKDTVAPAFTSAVFEKDATGAVTKVTLSFDEEVNLGANMDHSDLEVVGENGVLQSDLFTKTEVSGKKVVLTVKSGVKFGKFSIGLPAGFVVDKAISPNKSVATSTIVDFGKADAATTFDVTKAEAVANVITVTFPKAVVGGAFDGSATSLDRYTLNGKALPAGTKITLDSDQKVATITLPVGTIASTDEAAVFQISGVKALTGETSKFFTTTLKVTDNVAPVLTAAQLLSDGQTFVLTYDEALSASVGTNLGNEFKITVGGSAVTLTDAQFNKVSSTGKQIIAKVAATVTNNDAKAATATVSGNDASIATASNGDKATKDATYTYTVADNGAGGLQVNDASGNKVADLTTGNGTITEDNVTVTVTGATAGQTFTLTTTAPEAATTSALKLDTTKTVTIETVAGATDVLNFDIEDAAGNDQKAEVKLTTTR